MELRRHPAVLLRVGHVLAEAGAVVVIGVQQTGALQCAVDVQRGVGRQIAALGVAADPQRTVGAVPRHVLHVGHRAGLGRHRVHEAEVQVLLPAHQRPVGAHKGAEQRAVRNQEGHRVQLHLLFLVPHRLIAQHPHAAEPLGLRRQTHQGDVVVGGQPLLLVLRRHAGDHVAQRHGLVRLAAFQLRKAAEVQVGDDAQHQIVHLVKAVLGEGQVAPPAQIVEHRGFHGFFIFAHGVLLCLLMGVVSVNGNRAHRCGIVYHTRPAEASDGWGSDSVGEGLCPSLGSPFGRAVTAGD